MLKLAVIGKDVSQSSSPRMHQFIFQKLGQECVYDKISIVPEQFEERFSALLNEYDGLNVTIPFKGSAVSHLTQTKGDAVAFGVVNTVRCREREGYNTDGYGFLLMLENAGVCVKDRRVLVLGVGGAGRSCIKKLLDVGAAVFAYERNRERLQEVYCEFGAFTPLTHVPVAAYDIIINCTGIGMHDTVGKTPDIAYEGGEVSPVDERLLSLCTVAVDLIYVPEQSEFLRIAHSLGKQTVNGESMLFYQAYMSDCIYLNRQPSNEEAKLLWKQYSEEEL